MQKLFVLDTNVLLHEPGALFNFQEHDLVIPLQVIEELDQKKKAPGMLGYSARQAIRIIEALRKEQPDLSKGVPLGEDLGILHVELLNERLLAQLPVELRKQIQYVDNIILAIALGLQIKFPILEVILISKDANLRVKAGILGIIAEDYLTDAVDINYLYTGYQEVFASKEQIDFLCKNKSIGVEDSDFFPNEAVMLINELNENHTALAIADANQPSILNVVIPGKVYGNKGGMNREQHYAVAMMLNPDIDLVTITGSAGTGKTYMALLAGLAALDKGLVDQIIISRKFVHHGVKEGFIKGDLLEKCEPWMEPFYNNLEEILGSGDCKELKAAGKMGKNGAIPMKPYEYFFITDQIVIKHLSFSRGVTYTRKFIIIDEASNLTQEEAKNLIWRCGEGSTIVLLGDEKQIDDPYVDSSNNGLVYVIETWKTEPLAAHINLVKNQRSRLVDRAVQIM